MANYDSRVNGPTRGGCTLEAYSGGGVRAYTGRGVLPKYLQNEPRDLSVTHYAGKDAPQPTLEETAAQYRTQTINTGLPMVNSCKGTCRTEIGCTCKGTQ